MCQQWADGKQEKSPGQDQVIEHLYCTAVFILNLCCLTELNKDGGNAANKMDLELIYFPRLKNVMLNMYITGVLLSLFAFRIRLQSVRRRTCVNEHGSKIRIGFVSYVSGLALLIVSFFNRCIK